MKTWIDKLLDCLLNEKIVVFGIVFLFINLVFAAKAWAATPTCSRSPARSSVEFVHGCGTSNADTTPSMVVKVYRLKYAQCEEVAATVAAVLQPAKAVHENPATPSLTSMPWKVRPCKRINGLVVSATKPDLPVIESIIESLDVKLNHVKIETALIEVPVGDRHVRATDWLEKTVGTGAADLGKVLSAAREDDSVRIVATPALATMDCRLARLVQDQGVSVSALAVVNPNGNVVLDFELRLGGMDSAKGVFATEKVVGTGKTELLGCAPAGWDEGKAEREMLILVRATVLDR